MNLTQLKKYPRNLSMYDKLDVMKEYLSQKGIELKFSSDYRGSSTVHYSANKGKISIAGDVYDNKFSVKYSANKYKAMKTIVKLIESEIIRSQNRSDEQQVSNVLKQRFVQALQYSTNDFTINDDYLYGTNKFTKTVTYKGVTIDVTVSNAKKPSFKVTSPDSSDFEKIPEYINLFNDKWELTML